MKSNFSIFLKERVPVVANFILAFGLIFSVHTLSSSPMNWIVFSYLSILLVLFVTELRFMDEIKDFEKDKIAHPTRPLPRGLIPVSLVDRLVKITGFLLCSLAIGSYVFASVTAVIVFFIALFWLFLMYKEFFVGDWLSKRQILYAISHQVVIFPVVIYLACVFTPESAFSAPSIYLGFLILASFFTFEVGRKLNPDAHPILKTYVVVHGKKKVFALIFILQLIALYSAYQLNIFLWIFIPFVLMMISLGIYLKDSRKFKNTEGLIALNLIYAIWVFKIAKGF
jgi:hypothetical protein